MRAERGFTLIEVLVALSAGGLLVLLAHQAFGAATDFALALNRRGTRRDEVMETRRYLAAALGSVDAAAPGSRGFHGTPTRIELATWTDGGLRNVELVVAGGRLLAVSERDAARDAARDTAPETTRETARDTMRLMRALAFRADYLLAYGADAPWVQEWQSPVSAPLAVRLRIAHGDSSGVVDTLLLTIGPRG